MKGYSCITFLLTALLLFSGVGFAQPTAEEAATDTAKEAEYLDALEDMTVEEAAEALSALFQVIEASEIPRADIDAKIGGLLNSAMSRILIQDQPSFIIALVDQSTNRVKVVTISTIRLTRPAILDTPEIVTLLSEEPALQNASDNPEGALGNSYDGVVGTIESQGTEIVGGGDEPPPSGGDEPPSGGDEPPAGGEGGGNEPPPPPGQPPAPGTSSPAGDDGGVTPPPPQPAPYDGQA
jgi:hypothetical protein